MSDIEAFAKFLELQNYVNLEKDKGMRRGYCKIMNNPNSPTPDLVYEAESELMTNDWVLELYDNEWQWCEAGGDRLITNESRLWASVYAYNASMEGRGGNNDT